MTLRKRMIVAGVLTAAVLITKNRVVSSADWGDDHGGHQASSTWKWHGEVEDGNWVHIRNLNGAVRVENAEDGELEVLATKRVRRGTARDVRIVTNQRDGDVYVCALYNGKGQCDENGYHTTTGVSWWKKMLGKHSDVAVSFVVRLPEGVKIDANTVNGGITIDGVLSEVKASTVNGGVKATTSMGPMRISTVNGSISARVDSLGEDGGVSLSSVNGSVVAELPDKIDGQLDLSTVNGRYSTDFPVTMSGPISTKHLRATLGKGGSTIKLKTVNGSVTLRKHSAHSASPEG
ncbi:MAG: hypothetical protein WKG32_17695 [Gemmatimonadaceae bacterium]